METVKIDNKGRVVIPKSLRERAKIKRGGYVKIWSKGKTIIIEPVKSIAFKIEKWPENLDDFIIHVMRKWWTLKTT